MRIYLTHPEPPPAPCTISANVLVLAGVDGEGAAAAPAVESFGLKPEVKAPNISTMIESQFKSGGTGGWGAAADSAGSVPHEELMEKYVKDKMGGDVSEAGGGGAEGEGGAGAGGMLSEEDRLYTIPEDFKKKVGRLRHYGVRVMRAAAVALALSF